MHAPQIIMIILATLVVIIHIKEHKTRADLIGRLVSVASMLGLLYWGGFFSQP